MYYFDQTYFGNFSISFQAPPFNININNIYTSDLRRFSRISKFIWIYVHVINVQLSQKKKKKGK